VHRVVERLSPFEFEGLKNRRNRRNGCAERSVIGVEIDRNTERVVRRQFAQRAARWPPETKIQRSVASLDGGKQAEALNIGKHSQQLCLRPLVEFQVAVVRRNMRKLRDGDGLNVVGVEAAQKGDVVAAHPVCMCRFETDRPEQRMDERRCRHVLLPNRPTGH
jgi:hypothetical protein